MNLSPLPTRDEYTYYNYRLGASRMEAVALGNVRFVEDSNKFLVVKCRGNDTVVMWLPKDKTVEFALNCIKKYGKENGEKVLSATPTGALYWNMIHHYKTYAHFLSHNWVVYFRSKL